MQEKQKSSMPGIPMLVLALALILVGGVSILYFAKLDAPILILLLTVPIFIVAIFILKGLYNVEPNQAAVLSLFGKYVGTNRAPGLHFNNPFFSKKKISCRVRNFESGKLKVNDSNGSPIEIAAIVVWEVKDSAEAVFNVDNYESFVQIQSEAAIRSMATSYPYDPHEEGQKSLRTDPLDISAHMSKEVQDRLNQAGINVIETRISHLAYAPEIAQAMLQRQQAGAIIAARQRIVDGAVGMVETALEKLDENGVVKLDEERKAAMVSNLLVVLCSDRATQPVVNTGSLYS